MSRRKTVQPLPVYQSPSAARTRTPDRTSLAYLTLGIISRIAACVLLIVEAPALAGVGAWASPVALGLTHIVTLGFATSISFGVLYHIVPLSTGRTLPLRAFAPLVFSAYGAGTVLLVAGLWSTSENLLTAGGVICGVALFVVLTQLGIGLVRSKRHPILYAFQFIAGGALVLVTAAGVLLILAERGSSSIDVSAVLPAKILLGVGGWMGILVVGMSYVLMPMFTPTRARGRHQRASLIALATGFGGAAGGLLVHAPVVSGALLLIAAVGMTAFLVDTLSMAHGAVHGWRTPIVVGQVFGSALTVATTLLGALALALSSLPLALIAIVLSLWGWVSLQIAANAIRLIPFMVWLVLPAHQRPTSFVPGKAALGWLAVAAALLTSVSLTWGLLAGNGVLVRTAGIVDGLFTIALVGIMATALRQRIPIGR